ncbi:MAG: SPOR domain-containing protein, partial [Spirochaetota bacterium]
ASILVEYSDSFEADFIKQKLNNISEEKFIKLYYKDYDKIKDNTTNNDDTESIKKTELAGYGKYYIQIGAFSIKASAERYAERLIEEGFSADVYNKKKLVPDYDKDIYIVIIGFFSDIDRAKQVVKHLKSRGYDCFITQLPD